jgi:hypothetical protein
VDQQRGAHTGPKGRDSRICALPKNAESEPEVFLMLDVMDEILAKAH